MVFLILLCLLLGGAMFWLAGKEWLGTRVRVDGEWVDLPWEHRVPRKDRDSNFNVLRLHPDAKIPEGLKRPPSSIDSTTAG